MLNKIKQINEEINEKANTNKRGIDYKTISYKRDVNKLYFFFI